MQFLVLYSVWIYISPTGICWSNPSNLPNTFHCTSTVQYPTLKYAECITVSVCTLVGYPLSGSDIHCHLPHFLSCVLSLPGTPGAAPYGGCSRHFNQVEANMKLRSVLWSLVLACIIGLVPIKSTNKGANDEGYV